MSRRSGCWRTRNVSFFPRTALFGVTYSLRQLPGGVRDAAGPTFNFTQLFPSGFTPIFSGKIQDLSGTGGYRGKAGDLSYDLSAAYGQSRIRYGQLRQSETNLNADFSYPLAIGLASPLNVAWGIEYRREGQLDRLFRGYSGACCSTKVRVALCSTWTAFSGSSLGAS